VKVLNRITRDALASSWTQALKTATVNEQVAVLPDASVAVQVTVEVPTGKEEPEGGVHTAVAVTPAQLSETVPAATLGVTNATTALETPQDWGVTATTGPGQVIVGGVGSVTVTSNVQETKVNSTAMSMIVATGVLPNGVARPVVRSMLYSLDCPPDTRVA
jgi:hypothetical protein